MESQIGIFIDFPKIWNLMKLFIKREQFADTGLLGGHKGMKFQLSYRLEVTPEEKALVTKYKSEAYPLLIYKDNDGKVVNDLTVGRLMNGGKEVVKDITVLLNNEQNLKNACENFKTLLKVMATFGGEEVHEF